jgi:hypothetical protein
VLQPSYLPWLGYLEQIARADAFVFYDDVQYDKNGWRNRNRIRTPGDEGWSWLTIPVRIEGHFPPICEVRVDGRVPWRRKHLRSLEMAYARAAQREGLETYFGSFYRDGRDEGLADVAIDSVRRLMEAFEIRTPVYRSSELGVGGDRNTRLLNLCKRFAATHYYSGAAAKAYLDVELFERQGITVEWQNFAHPVYAQAHEPFVSHLSAIDAVLNVGARARFLLRNEAELV